MREDISLHRKSLAGVAALVVAAASLAVLPRAAHTADELEHVEGQQCLENCDKMNEICCINNSDPIG